LWKIKNVILCSSAHALKEYRINLEEENQWSRLRQLAEVVHLFEASEQKLPQGISLPGKDVPILLAAIEARATHLLTGDIRHFGAYLGKKIAGIVIFPPGDYLRLKAGRE